MLNNYKNSGLSVLDRNDFERICPSFYATAPKNDVSSQYSFLNTRNIAKQLHDMNWFPVSASESNSRDKSNKGFTKHIIKFGNKEMNLGGERIELVLVNAHNRASSLQFHAGIFREICSNGLVTQTGDLGQFRVIHKGDIEQQVTQAIANISSMAGTLGGRIQDFKNIELTPDQQGVFAQAAHEYIYNEPETAPISSGQLLIPRRGNDSQGGTYYNFGSRALPKSDLWTTFNVVQENAIKGGIRGRNKNTHKRTKTRQIKSIDKDVRLNKALWSLTEQMSELVA